MHQAMDSQAPEKYPRRRIEKGLQGSGLIVKLFGILA
jgi:hypothetical protein